jgi:hypothetical protein
MKLAFFRYIHYARMEIMKISLDKLFLILVILGAMIFVIRPIEDPDFWWHLKTGQLILQDKQIPYFDDYSFTSAGKPWIAHEWLSEIIMFSTYKAGGIPFTVIFFGLLILSSFILSIFRAENRNNLYAIGGALLLGVILSTPVLWPRPQIFSLLYASTFLLLLDRFLKTNRIRYLIPLPIIMLLWVNQHGAFIIGLGIIGIYIIGSFIDRLILISKEKKGIRKVFTKTLWIILVTLVICFLAVLVNPNGSRMFIYPFQTVSDSSLQEFNQEWASPNFHERTWIPLAVMYLSLIGFGLKAKKSISTINILLCVVFGYLTLLALKQVALFAIVSIPILSDLISNVIPFTRRKDQSNRLVTPLAFVSIAGIVLIGANSIIHLEKKQSAFMDQFFPTKSVEFITKEGIKGNIFNSYNWGGYLIWNMYPEQKVYIDGRCDMYGAEFVTRFVDIYTTKPGWENALKADKIQYVLVEPNTYLAYGLLDQPGWKAIYSDEVSVLFKYDNQ